MGMVSAPVVTVFAIADPEIDPMAAEAITLAFAGPPRNRPAAAKARPMKNRPAPVTSRKAPKRTKMNTVPAAIPSGVPNSAGAREDLETQDPLEAETAIRDHIGQQVPEPRVEEEDEAHRDHHPAHGPARGLEQEDDEGEAHDQVVGA